MRARRGILALAALSLLAPAVAAQELPPELVRTVRCPGGGLQPRVVVADDVVHLIYLTGDPAAGDLAYVRSQDWGESWSAPLRVNSQPGSVDASEGARGARLALGRDGRAHVVWLGSAEAEPRGPDGTTPLLYTHLVAPPAGGGSGFAPQRNLVRENLGLDAAPGIAADGEGRVFVAWHAPGETRAEPLEGSGETGRQVFAVLSRDGGATFGDERAIDDGELGASAACGIAAHWDDSGLFVLYRISDGRRRDLRLLASSDGGESFEASLVDNWTRSRNPRSSAVITQGPRRPMCAWEARGNVWWAPIRNNLRTTLPYGARPRELWRERPSLAGSARGATVLAWLEGEQEHRPTRLGWQAFSNARRANIGEGTVEDVDPNTAPAVFVLPDHSFTILY